jgi:feruloyl esterase
LCGTARRPRRSCSLKSFLRYLAYSKQDPNLALASVGIEGDASRLEWISQVLNATDTDLSGFRERGGKLLMWFGWADPALNASRAVEY